MAQLKSTLIFLLFGFSIVSAQDKHFTLYNLTPLALNPALTGASTSELRAGALYRNQWRAVDKPFSTITAYGDKKIFLKHFDLGIGLSFLNDRSGPGGLNVVNVFPSVSIQRRFGNHNLILGVQPGIVHKKLQDATHPNQYDHSTGSYTTALPSGESTNAYNTAYFDLNAGLTYIFRTDKSEFQIGQAFHHLTSPNESIIANADNKLPIRYSTHAAYLNWISDKMYLNPSVLYMSHNKASEFALNIFAGRKIIYNEEMQLLGRIGLAYRNNIKNVNGDNFLSNSDAVSVLAGATWNKVALDFAYDINASSLSDVGRNAGAFEIALTYRNMFERKTDIITVPCRRY